MSRSFFRRNHHISIKEEEEEEENYFHLFVIFKTIHLKHRVNVIAMKL